MAKVSTGVIYENEDELFNFSEEPKEPTPTPTVTEVTQTDDTITIEEESLILDILKSKGIDNINEIQFEDEDGNIEKRSWADLTKEEQKAILSDAEEEVPSNDLDDLEIELLNSIRTNKMSPNDYIDYIKQQAIAEYAASLDGQVSYKVDEFSDDELYILDLQTKIPDLTEEEMTLALQHAKENEVIYNKQILGLREQYKNIETENKEQEQLQAEEQERANQEEALTQIHAAISTLNEVGGFQVELEDTDIEEIETFILGKDPAGVRYLERALNDPETLVKMAWSNLKGDEAIASITDYYKQQIKEVSKTNYQKGFDDAKKGVTQKVSPKVIIAPKSNKTFGNDGNRIKTINDLDENY